MIKYNSKLLPQGYFSKEAVPYWCLVALDCIVLVGAGVMSLYVIFGGVGLISNFWDSVKIWIMSLPIFLLFMHLFRTYVGTLLDTPLKCFERLACALALGGMMLRIALLLVPAGQIIDFTPGTYIIATTVLISLAVQWTLRMIARYMFRGHEDEPAENLFFRTLKIGTYSDTSIHAQKKINLCLAHMSEAGLEQKYVKEAFDTNWVVPLGPNVNAFEDDLCRFVNDRSTSGNPDTPLDKKVVALSAGTAAVHLALRACGVLPGDEVIVQTFTFCASANPVAYVGAIPVFVDSEPETWNMDPKLLEHAIQDRIEKVGRAPKAIIPVALYGMPYQIDRIMEVANRYNIPVIEDAAEGFGSRFGGQVLGTFGRFGVLSFNGNKMITTSGGGALVCQDDASRNNIMWFATQARESYPYYQHEAIGYNYRLSNVCAGIGRGQMTVANDHIAHHKHVQALYEELLADVPGLHVHRQPADPRYDANYWLCTFTLDADVHVIGEEDAYKAIVRGAVGGAAGVIHMADSATTDCQPNANIEAMRVYLDKCQIEARPVWKPMHKQPVFQNAPAYVNGVSEAIFKTGMCIPAGPCVSDQDVRYIVKCIKEAIVK